MQNNFSKCREWVPRGTSQHKWRWLTTLLLILTLGIGQMWGATSTSPATVSYGNKTFLNVAATDANARIKNADSTLVYNATYLLKTLTPAWIDGTTATDKSDSKSNYANLPDYGFLAEASSSSANSNNSGGYSYVKITSAKEYVIYVTGTNSIAFLGKGNSNSSNKWIGVKVEEIDSNGDATVVANAVDNKNYSSSNAITEATTNTSSEVLTISPSKYYRVTITSGYTSNCQVWQFRFGKVSGYSVTYVENGHGANQTDLTGQTKLPSTLPTLSESGWIFGGWYTDEGLTTPAVAGATLSANATLYAKWTEDTSVTKYSVTYVLNGPSGEAPTQASVAAGTEITLAAAPSWAGYAFDGWLCSADAAVKTAGSAYTMTAANTTFTAQWHEVDCKIYSLTGGIGSAVVTASDATVNDGVSLILSNTAGRIKLTPAGGETFKAGDIITISGYTGSATKKFGVYVKNAAGSSNIATAEVANLGECIASATLSADAEYVFLARKEGTTMNILTCEIHRSCAEGTAAGLSYATAEVNKTEGDAAFTNALTNANGLVVAGYSSSNTAVATVDKAGQVTIVAPGTATITAHSAVQTKAGTLYAAGTATYTLNVAALPEYTVTYDLNGGSGDPTEVDHKAGEKFNLHDGVTGITAPTSKTFVNWKDQDDALFAGGAEYTMPAKNVTLTAQWAGDVYTVKYMDGETVLDTKVVEVGSHPTDIEHPTKPLYTFASWQLSGSDVVLDDVNGTKDAEIILTVRWAKVYAADIDFEAFIDANTTGGDWSAELADKHYAISSTTGVTLDAPNEKPADKGLKIKNSGSYLSFNVHAGKLVLLKAGVLSGAEASVDGGAHYATLTGATGSTAASVVTPLYNAAEAEYRIRTTTGSYNIIQSVTIQDPYQVTFDANGGEDVASLNGTPSVMLPLPVKGTESFLGWFDGDTKVGEAGESYTPTANITLVAHWEAISTDARLASISFSSDAGTLSPAFDPEVVNYTYTMPYGTAAIPTIIGATSVSAKAQDPIIGEAAAAWSGTQTIQGVAQSGDKKTYTITMVKAPKDGVSIIKVATTGGTNKTVTGLYAGDGDVKLSGDTKMNDGNYIGFILDGTTLQAGDRINVHTTTAANTGGSHVIFFDNMTDKNELYETGEIGDLGDNIFTINAAMVGATTAYVYRSNADAAHKWNGYVDYIEVTRAMNPVLKSIQFNSTDVAVSSTSVSATLPYGTNLGTMTITPEIIWNGAAAENSILINGSATGAWAWGENTYKLTDKDGDATTYTITLTEADHYEAQIGTTGYATLVAAVAAAQADDVVKLLDNVDLMATGLTIAENITLDLNGFNIKAGEQIDNDIVVPAGKKLTLVDNSTDADGKIYTEQAYTGTVTGYGLVRVAGELLMQSGNIYAVIDSDPANLGQFAVVLGAGGKATIEGGQIKAGWYAISNNGNNTGSTIIVSGGELISTADFAIYNPAKESTVTVSGGVVYGAAGGIAMNRGELTVTGGTITSKDQGTTGTWGDGTGGLSNAAIAASGKYESVNVEITGGTIIAEGSAVMITNGTTNPVEVAISGGQFSHVVPAEYCADGFAPVTEPNAQGKYEVEDKRIYIFDGSTMSNMATSPSGAISWAKVGDVMSATDKSGTYDEVNYTKALQLGNSSTTKHFKIDVALNNAAKIEVIGMSNSSSGTRHAWLTNSTDKGEIANAIASLATTGYNPEMFATDWLEEGSYYLHADNTVNIFLIRVTSKEVDPKCEQPTITTQPATDLTFGAGNMTATVVAEVSDEGTLTYQWYNAANDEAVVGQTTATLTTADEGTYYVIVTNTKASHRDNSIKSDEAQLAHRVLNDATLSALGYGDPATAIALEADKYDYRVDLAMGTIDVPELTATATMAPYPVVSITNATEFVNYEATSTVLVTAEDGITQKTYTVKFVVDHVYTTLVDVTESTTWNWKNAATEDVTIDDVANKGTIIANYLSGANFEKIEGKANEKAFRNQNEGVYQGTHLHFNTTVPGKVKFYFRAPSSGENCTITVKNNGKEMVAGTRGNSLGWSKEIVVKGDVVIEMENDKEGGGTTRVQQIVFTELTPDYTRNVTNNIGTLCVDHNVLVGGAMGATFYQIASRNEQYNDKIDFEEVLPNEELKAGEPYIFKSTTGKIELYYGETEADAPVAVRGMIGSFVDAHVDITSENMSDILYIANNRLWNCEDMVGGYLDVVANRAYIVMSDVPTYADYQAAQTSNPAPRRRVTLGKDAEQTATGLENLVGGEQAQKLMINGQMYILRGEKLYDATGRLVK